MAKKKKDETETESGSAVSVEDLLTKFSKEFGNIVYETKDILEEKIDIIPVTPGLDMGLSGGIPEATWGVITGKEKAGKTTLAMHIASKAQQRNKNRHVFFLAPENRYKKKNLELILDNHPNFDRDRFHVIMSTAEKILTAEDFLNIAEHILRNIPHSVVIVDSYSMLSSELEQTQELGKEIRGGSNKLLNAWFRRMSGPLRANKQIVIGITHIIANPSGYGSPYMEKSGAGIKYSCDWKLSVKSCTVDKSEGDLKASKQDVEWEVKESALGQGGAVIKTFLVYDKGYDENYEMAEISSELGLIEKKGSWFKLLFLEDIVDPLPNLQGMEKVRNYLENEPAHADLLRKKLCELWG